MSGQFKVGEVLVGQNHVKGIDRNGMECTVLGALSQRVCHHESVDESYIAMRYHVVWADGMETHAAQNKLRRKQPPAGEQSVLDMFKLPAPREVEVV
jgi:hypothetical protein